MSFYKEKGRVVWTKEPAGKGVAVTKAFGDPDAGAYRFSISTQDDTFDAYLGLVDYQSFKALNLRYKLPQDSVWIFLVAPETDNAAVSQSDVIADMQEMLVIINKAIKEKFGDVVSTPGLTGEAFLRWLIKNSVSFVNGALVLDPSVE